MGSYRRGPHQPLYPSVRFLEASFFTLSHPNQSSYCCHGKETLRGGARKSGAHRGAPLRRDGPQWPPFLLRGRENIFRTSEGSGKSAEERETLARRSNPEASWFRAG